MEIQMNQSILSYFDQVQPLQTTETTKSENLKSIKNPFNQQIENKNNKHINDIKEIVEKSKIDKIKQEILKKLIKFYKKSYNGKTYNKELLVPIVNQQTTISLRLLDWLVTNYSKNNDIRYQLGGNKGDSEYIPSSENFNLWLDYKNQLKAYSKSNFDPFCRRERIFYNTQTDEIELFPKKKPDPERYDALIKKYSERNDGIVTTVGQLNFFKWAIEKEVIDYAFENLKNIEADMLSSADERIIAKKNNMGGVKNRRKLSKNNNSARYHELKVIVEFPN